MLFGDVRCDDLEDPGRDPAQGDRVVLGRAADQVGLGVTAVLAINSPKHRQHSGTPKGLGHAFCEYVTRYPADRLPQAGGVDATVVVP